MGLALMVDFLRFGGAYNLGTVYAYHSLKTLGLMAHLKHRAVPTRVFGVRNASMLSPEGVRVEALSTQQSHRA